MSRAEEVPGAVVPVVAAEAGAKTETETETAAGAGADVDAVRGDVPQLPSSEGKDAAEQPHEVTGSDWGGAMLFFLPPLLIRNFTGLGTGWLVTAWAFWALAAAVMTLIWVLMRERGVRKARGWFSCGLAHFALVVNALMLVAMPRS